MKKNLIPAMGINLLLIGILFFSSCATEQILVDSRDGQEYATVKIGSQTWMAENLNFATDHSWYYNNDSAEYAGKYGRLYSWEAATTACPSDWHLPSDEEWKTLEEFISLNPEELEIAGYRGDSVAVQIKTGGKTGLNLDFGGYRMMWGEGSFHYAGDYGDYWTNTQSAQAEGWYRNVSRFQNTIYRNSINIAIGNSVRCVKDNE